MKSTVINDKIKLVRGDDQIFKYIAINNCTLDMDTMKKMSKTGDAWNGTELCANLIDLRNMTFVDFKTREFAADQYRPHVAGQAILIESNISKYFANLFLKFTRPKLPTKLFTKEDEALKWLNNQLIRRRRAQRANI
jgi:hypothetical protein